jgi:hypothetical protein
MECKPGVGLLLILHSAFRSWLFELRPVHRAHHRVALLYVYSFVSEPFRYHTCVSLHSRYPPVAIGSAGVTGEYRRACST